MALGMGLGVLWVALWMGRSEPGSDAARRPAETLDAPLGAAPGGHEPKAPLVQGSGRSEIRDLDRLLEVWIREENEEVARPFRGSGLLEYRALPAGDIVELPVEAGVAELPPAVLAGNSEPISRDGAQIRAYLISFASEEGRTAVPADPLPSKGPEGHLVAHFVYRSEWTLRVTDKETGLPLRGIRVLEETFAPWGLSTLLTPPGAAHEIISGADGRVHLEPTDPGTVYWLVTEGYAWFAYRWDRRHHLGREVRLERASTLDVHCSDDPTATLELQVIDARREVVAQWACPAPLEERPLLKPGTVLTLPVFFGHPR